MTYGIAHDLTIRTPPARVFAGVSSAIGLDAWWTENCSGIARVGEEYKLGFGGDFYWRARVESCSPDQSIMFKMTDASADWQGTTISFVLEAAEDDATVLRFEHLGWEEQSPHFRRSSYCWAMYLRLLRIYCETGAVTQYGDRYFA